MQEPFFKNIANPASARKKRANNARLKSAKMRGYANKNRCFAFFWLVQQAAS